MCTNGFVDHTVQDGRGRELRLADDQVIEGQVAHMTAFSEEQPRSPEPSATSETPQSATTLRRTPTSPVAPTTAPIPLSP